MSGAVERRIAWQHGSPSAQPRVDSFSLQSLASWRPKRLESFRPIFRAVTLSYQHTPPQVWGHEYVQSTPAQLLLSQ
jgi:hypothetical protein